MAQKKKQKEEGENKRSLSIHQLFELCIIIILVFSDMLQKQLLLNKAFYLEIISNHYTLTYTQFSTFLWCKGT